MPSKTLAVCLSALALAACPAPSGPTPACGSRGDACCDGTACNSGLSCLSNVCAVAGSSSTGSNGHGTSAGSASGGTTGGSAGTSSGTGSGGSSTGAQACGAVSEDCCAGGVCNGSLVCQGGSCQQPAAGVSGAPCSKNSDCSTGICLPVGQPVGGQASGERAWTGNVCSTTCGSAAGCVAGWSCAALAGQPGDVCQCSYAPEVCDGNDNDCDGTVDDEPQVDQACQTQLGSGAACRGGQCLCAGATTLCGSACVDTQSDDGNCGGCAGQGGQVCPAAQSCSAGVCQCPGGGTLCGSACSDTQTDSRNCGGCAGQGGQVCPAVQSCVAGSCSCPAAGTLCGAVCTNTSTDPQNCGGCAGAGGQVCAAPTLSCAAGVCGCPAGQTLCGSLCANLQTDLQNCGGCGQACPSAQSCGGGNCVCPGGGTLCGSVCTAPGPSGACTLATGQDPTALALDRNFVYWTDTGAVMKVPINGGLASTVVSGQPGPCCGIAVSNGSVYWLDNVSNTVMSMVLAGGTPTPLATQVRAEALVVTGGSAYWVESDAVMTVALDGGTATLVAAGGIGSVLFSLTTDGSSLYWTDSDLGTVTQAPLDGGTPTTLASGLVDPWGIAVDGRSAYWNALSASPSTETVMSVALGGGAPATLASYPSANPLTPSNGIAVDGSAVYWLDSQTVSAVALDGGTPVTLATGLVKGSGLALDATSVYWTDIGADPAFPGGGQVMKIAK